MESKIRRKFAIYAITKHGLAIGRKLAEHLDQADLWVSYKFIDQAPEHSLQLDLPLGPQLEKNFFAYDCHIFIISVGAVVRMIAPLIGDKKSDPAVICVDDKGQFAISLLSGHVGRGNEFTQVVARLLDAIPVITTASDVQGTLTVDILGRELGWTLEDDHHNVTRGCAAVVNEAHVALVQETGEPEFWPLDRPLPPGVHYTNNLQTVERERAEIILYISDRSLNSIDPDIYEHAIVYRPKSLVIGIGCDRDTPFEMLERGLQQLLEREQLSIKSVAALATVDLKGDEKGLIALAEKYQWPLLTYTPEVLDQVEGIANPSMTVRKFTGTRTVAEGAALIASGSQQLLVEKQKYSEATIAKNMTLAICRKPYGTRREGNIV